MQRVSLLTAALVGLAAAAAQAQPVVQGGILTDPAGRTLYVFDKDPPGTSHCTGACLQAWPAYNADPAGGAQMHPKVKRLASRQWAWNDKPLYYFAGDAAPGDKAGDGSGGVWHIVKPADGTQAASTGYRY